VAIPSGARGVVVFAHGSGSGRLSPRNRLVAEELHRKGLATVLFDLLTPREAAAEAESASLRFNIPLLTERLAEVVRWVRGYQPLSQLGIGLFGASTGAAAALAVSAINPDVQAVVSRGGRTDLAADSIDRVNARVVRNAEEYYRNLFRSDVSSWNLRDRHMTEALVELATHLQSHHGRAKIIVWAHNSHVGDARATAMSRRGECNVGQLVREAFPGQSKIVGFMTYTGSVTASSGWHLPAERKHVRPAVESSYEHLFHQTGIPGFWLDLTARNAAVDVLRAERLERAIGVVYLPQSELRSHCFHASMPGQFDAVVHIDRTRAVEPLERTSAWRTDEAPETFPAGV